MKQRNGEKSQYHSQRVTRAMPKLETLKAKERKRKNPNAHRAMRSARSRRKGQFSPPTTSKQYSSQHELPVRVVPRGGRRTVSVSKKKKSTKSSPSHMRKREREMRARREKRKEKKRNVRAPVCTPAWPMWMEITSLIFVVVVVVVVGSF